MAKPPPGVTRSPELHAKLETALAAKGTEYEPRTDLKDADKPRYLNRLILEPSPYLLQHAHNPVDWWPWGDAAMAEAARRNVPLFISAGYATCHWCHVMEEESFDNEHVAALLNANFVAIKLDREQRPDIDQIYITATSVQQGHAGWPNSIWATPDGKPFHTGTYFPRPQFLEMLTGIAGGWREKQAEFEAFADRFSTQLQTITRQRAQAADLAGLPDTALANLKHAHNPTDGGFSTGTQFPHEGFLLFLIDHWRRGGNTEALKIARRSLDAMAEGGFHDHIGGGFHRYTVDVNWRTPHFEKMLYNQALLMQCYTQLWQVTDAPEHARSVARCVEYLRRDMTAPDGAFYSAEDADSLDADGKREEGAFYVWSPEAATKVLGKDASELIEWLNLRAPLTLEAGPIAHLAPGAKLDFVTLDPMLDKLRKAREDRPRPIRDDKVIGGWNGLMIRALAEAGHAFDRDDWTAMAERAATAVFFRLTTKTGLARFHAEGTQVEDANLTDHTWLALACVALFDATADDGWLARATALTDTLLERFSAEDGRLALVREGTPFGAVFEMEDGAVPSGESSALELLALLEARAPNTARRSAADALAAVLSGAIAKNPTTRLPAITAWRILTEGESGSARSLAGGALRTDLRRVAGEWHLHVHPARGWHISASNENGLAGARLEGAQTTWLEPKSWPSPLGDDLPAYTESLELVLTAPKDEITLHLQLCSESECLAPITIKYRLQ